MPKNQQAQHVHLAFDRLAKQPDRWFTSWEASRGGFSWERRKWSRALDELAQAGYAEKRRVTHGSKDRGGMVEFKYKEHPYVKATNA